MKTRSSKSRKIDIFPTFCCLGNLGQGNVFYDILEQKTLFLAIKKRSSKTQKIHKGLTHGFGPKMAVFPTFFF